MERARLPVRMLAAAGFALVLAGGFQPFYFSVFFRDRAAARDFLTELPFRKTPGLRALLEEARARTRPGERVVLLTPHTSWEGGYRYSFRAAQYLLAGRSVRPVIGRGDGDLSANLDVADVVVAWKREPPPGWRVVWRGDGSAVARRGP